VDRRNEEELTEDDLLKACAVKWLGKERQSGEKRLVKGFNREVIVVAGRGREQCAQQEHEAQEDEAQEDEPRGICQEGRRGKRTRNSLESDHEQQLLRDQ
jgi:hypothetical protein